MSNRQLVAEKELNQQLVKDKISQARKQKKLIKELKVMRLLTDQHSRHLCVHVCVHVYRIRWKGWSSL